MGFLFLILYPGLLRLLLVLLPPPAASTYPNVTYNNFTYPNLTHTNFTHTNFTYNNFTYNNFTYPNVTYNNFTHTNLTYTNFTYNNFTYPNVTYNNFTHTNLTYTNFTYNNFTYPNITYNNFTHTNLTYNNFTYINTHKLHTYNNFTYNNFTYPNVTNSNFTYPNVTYNNFTLSRGRFAWQAWHLVTSTLVSRGRHFAWQAWHLVTSTLVSRGRRGTKLASTVVLRGRRGTHGTGWRAWSGLGACDAAALCVAGVAQPDIHLGFTWQAWHKVTSTVVLRGRRGTDGTGWRAWSGLGACDAAALCVAGVAQPDIHLGFTWQAWHKLTSTVVLRGRRGTDGTGWRAWSGLGACDAAALCVAGVAQPDIHPGFTWQAWHKVTSTVVLRGRRGTDGTGWRAWSGLGACDAAALCVAGVAQPGIHLGFTWQAWHKVTSTVVLRGRRGTDGTGWRAWSGLGACDAAALCVAGVAQPDIHLGFTWQAWHKVTSTVVLRGTTLVSRGRRGTKSHPPSFCVAGVGQMALGGALGPAWAPVTPRHFAWQAWHNLTSTLVSRGRRGTKSHPPSFCVAGVGQMALGGALGPAWAPVTPRHFAWQAWHNLTSTLVSRGRRGTESHPPSFCVAPPWFHVAGVAQSHIHRRFAWQELSHNLLPTRVSRPDNESSNL